MRYIITLICLIAFALPAFAQFSGPAAAGAQITTVSQVKDAKDHTRCLFEGNITERLAKDDKYTFKDATGSVTAEIKTHVFNGRTITPETKVRIYCEVDNEYFEKIKVEVKQLEIIQ